MKKNKRSKSMNELQVWTEQEIEIKNGFGKNLTDAQFVNFMMMGKSLNLNPFLREIWAIPYNGAVSIFIARDGYRRNAVCQPDYNGHIADSIYDDDTFRVLSGIPEHEYGKERKTLIGAYCVCWKKGIKIPFFVKVNLGEYFKGKSPIWREKPETMIKKVAEAQCLKGAYPDIFKGTYSDSESWKDEPVYDKEKTIIPAKEAPVEIPNPKKTRKKAKPKPKANPEPKLDNEKYGVESTYTKKEKEAIDKNLQESTETVDLSDASPYQPEKISDELSGLCSQISIGWKHCQMHDIHIAKSLKKHLKVKFLHECEDLKKLHKYYQHLRAKYFEMKKDK